MHFRAFVILLVSSGIVLLGEYLAVPVPLLRQTITILLGIIVLLLASFAVPSLQKIVLKKGRWMLFFIATLLIQLLLIITGGLLSPYLVLIHLFFLGISFLFSLRIALFFLGFAFVTLFIQIVSDPIALGLFAENPGPTILYCVSFLTVVPLAYVLTQHYKSKDVMSKTLTDQIKVEESILADISEMILVIDSKGIIQSLNDAVERVLHKSRSEILQQSLFNILIIKDEEGRLFNDPAFFNQKEGRSLNNISLLTSFGMVRGAMRIKPIDDLEGESGQVSIIISLNSQGQSNEENSYVTLLQEAITRHDALFEDLKKRLALRELNDLKDKAEIIEKHAKDIRVVRELQGEIQEQKVSIDLASLCRQTVIRQGEYARAFGVLLDFSFINFGEADIKPLMSGSAGIVSPDQLTGPFFTALCDVKFMGIVLEKLLDLAILIVPKLQDKTVRMTLERVGTTDLLIKVTCNNNTLITTEELPKLFLPYYGALNNKTDLHHGSGLEGFIAREVSNQLHYPLQVNLTKDSKRIVFMMMVNKGEQSLSTLTSQQKNSI